MMVLPNSKFNDMQKIIFDCDIGWLNDDATALIFAIKSSNIEVLGVTPVAGNFDLTNSVISALKVLEEMDCIDIPVCPGFDRPLIHERDSYSDKVWGDWAKILPLESLPGKVPVNEPDKRHACDFIAETILENPGEVTLIATGPLTNVAVAIRKYPEIVNKVKQTIIMGGNIPLLPRGYGNITPSAEFNFWVDPEAASIVLRSGISIDLCPLNVCRLTSFKREYFERIINSNSNLAAFYEIGLGPHFAVEGVDSAKPRLFYGLYDSICIAYAISPDLFKIMEMNVSVDITKGPNYGASYGYVEDNYVPGEISWPLEENSNKLNVIWDVDIQAFVDLWLSTILSK